VRHNFSHRRDATDAFVSKRVGPYARLEAAQSERPEALNRRVADHEAGPSRTSLARALARAGFRVERLDLSPRASCIGASPALPGIGTPFPSGSGLGSAARSLAPAVRAVWD
jgi:hypothetical protein